MDKLRFIILCLLGLQLFSSLHSAPAAASQEIRFTLQEAVARAIKNNTMIKGANENQMAAVEGRKSARADFFPKASAVYSYTNISETPYIINQGSKAPMAHTDQFHWDVSVTQPLFTGFALSTQYRMAKRDVETSVIEKELAVMDIVHQVKTAYYNVLLAKKYAHVTYEAVHNIESHKKDAEKYYDQGMIPYNDLLRANVALADALQNRERAEAGVTMAISLLNSLLDLDIDSQTKIEDIEAISPFSDTFPDLVDEAIQNRPELKVIRLGIQKMEDGIKLVKSAYFPQVVMVGRYEQNGNNPSATDNDFTNKYNSMLILQAEWKFYEWGKTKADVAKYNFEKRTLIENMKGLEDGIRLEIKNAFLNLQVAEKNITTARESLAQAKENWRITNLQYQQQVATSTEVLDARTYLTQAETNYYQALYGYMISLSELERAAGRK